MTFLQPSLALSCYRPDTWNINIQEHDVRACLTTTNDTTMVAIPGTDPSNYSDDFADLLDALPTDDAKLGLVGRGPSLRADVLWHAIKDRLPPVWHITGHSLGGAIAMDVAALAIADGIAPASIMTFAAPLCLGNESAKRVVNIPGVDFARHGDPIPHVPGLWWLVRPRPLTMLGDPVMFSSILKYHPMAGYEILSLEWLKSYSMEVH